MRFKKPSPCLYRSEKGDAIILLSVLVTGIVMLISVIAVENLRKSIEIQNVQKESLDSLYQAEEGIEYSLYLNKEKNVSLSNSNTNKPFNISVWENNNKEVGEEATRKLAQPTEGKEVVVVSEVNDNVDMKRAVFTNLPSRYYDQVSLWNSTGECEEGAQSCGPISGENDMTEGNIYQAIVTNTDFQKDGWDNNNIWYRLIFKCGGSQYLEVGGINIQGCEVRDLRVATDCDWATCSASEGSGGISNCTSPFVSVNFSNGTDRMLGDVVSSEWFQYAGSDGQPVDLRSKKIVVEFKLENGTMEEIGGLSSQDGDIKMCKQEDDGSWRPFSDSRGGLVSVEIKNETELNPN